MATLTIGLSGSAVVNGSRSWTISDADVQRLIDYMSIKFRDNKNDPTPLTSAQALNAWVGNFVANTKGEVENDLRTKAAQTAQAGISPIVFT